MRKYFEYLGYVLRHKWFVFLECCKLGIPFLGIIHDLSKFKYSEFKIYANYFYDEKYNREKEMQKKGYYIPPDFGDEHFCVAWLKHQRLNKHHWQYWFLIRDIGDYHLVEIPKRYTKEMLADWRGAKRAQRNKDSVLDWYNKYKDKIHLHQNTKRWIEDQLNEE